MSFRKEVEKSIYEILEIVKKKKNTVWLSISYLISFMSVIVVVILQIKKQGVKTEDTIIIIALIALFIPLLQIISAQRNDTNERILNLLILSTYISLFNEGKIDEHDKKSFYRNYKL